MEDPDELAYIAKERLARARAEQEEAEEEDAYAAYLVREQREMRNRKARERAEQAEADRLWTGRGSPSLVGAQAALALTTLTMAVLEAMKM